MKKIQLHKYKPPEMEKELDLQNTRGPALDLRLD
jgi:hypothetical protein